MKIDRWEHNGVVYVDAHEIIKELEKENKNLKNDLADHHKREIDDATDYVILFRKWAIASTLLLISLIMNFILIID